MLTSIGDVMREAHHRGWISVRDGNISVRRRDSFYITPSGGRKTIIHPEHILKFKVSPDGHFDHTGNPGGKASGEFLMHKLLVSVDFKASRSVVHLHPTHVIAAMEAGWDLRKISNRLQELSRYTRVGPNVERLPVTSEELAKHTFAAFLGPFGKLDYDIVGQIGHGVTSIGKSPWDAFEHIERLNHACEIMLLSGVSPND